MLTAKEVKVLELNCSKGPLGLYKVTSEWEGFKKLESISDNGVLIVAPKVQGPMISTFQDLFGDVFGNTPLREMHIISASPDLILMLQGDTSNTDDRRAQEQTK